VAELSLLAVEAVCSYSTGSQEPHHAISLEPPRPAPTLPPVAFSSPRLAAPTLGVAVAHQVRLAVCDSGQTRLWMLSTRVFPSHPRSKPETP
jgi:hypothetical protein